MFGKSWRVRKIVITAGSEVCLKDLLGRCRVDRISSNRPVEIHSGDDGRFTVRPHEDCQIDAASADVYVVALSSDASIICVTR